VKQKQEKIHYTRPSLRFNFELLLNQNLHIIFIDNLGETHWMAFFILFSNKTAAWRLSISQDERSTPF